MATTQIAHPGSCFGLFAGDFVCGKCKDSARCKAVLYTDGIDIAADMLDSMIEALPEESAYMGVKFVANVLSQIIDPPTKKYVAPSGPPPQEAGPPNASGWRIESDADGVKVNGRRVPRESLVQLNIPELAPFLSGEAPSGSALMGKADEGMSSGLQGLLSALDVLDDDDLDNIANLVTPSNTGKPAPGFLETMSAINSAGLDSMI